MPCGIHVPILETGSEVSTIKGPGLTLFDHSLAGCASVDNYSISTPLILQADSSCPAAGVPTSVVAAAPASPGDDFLHHELKSAILCEILLHYAYLLCFCLS